MMPPKATRLTSIATSCLLLAAATLVAIAQRAHADAFPSAERSIEIVDHVDRLLRGDSSDAEVEMIVVTRRWERSMTLSILSEGTDYALVRVLAPRREANTATLKVGPDIWNYLPGVDRTIRVPSSMMMAQWMGSHFTNDDLVQRSRMIEDYTIEASFAGDRDGVAMYGFTLTPRPEAVVVWGRIEIDVRSDDLMPVESRYYGEDGGLRRTMTFAEHRELGSRLVPTRIRLTPEDRDGEYTEMRYRQIEFDVEIPERAFSLAALR